MAYDEKTHQLIDGEERHRDHPETWDLPDIAARLDMQVNHFAKIGVMSPKGGERFWVKIIAKTATGYIGEVDNDLVVYPELEIGTMIPVLPKHILDILV